MSWTFMAGSKRFRDVGGVSLYHRSALVETSESQIKVMLLAAYRPMLNLNIVHEDWKLDNFNLVDGRIVFLDLELASELDHDREYAAEMGYAALLEKWNVFRMQYEEYGEVE
ncbi:Protein kinase-like domain protein [Cordyceps fumosorosea ARSEF 2679]|uniref:Protein kinase-like domain protein n=1 Tax=Cordyceps fumosorosea (strain ARSEF 2679) TaxID=1081104 RepID=A0A167QNH5_CORFA|nr:Protein kinase-like domain protein [Cordyceps fumosorosea ARSEF 2679]OAA57801.1 Protein kinase-like domain protein [Cordyceps fumosorosea ARSEF 2679]